MRPVPLVAAVLVLCVAGCGSASVSGRGTSGRAHHRTHPQHTSTGRTHRPSSSPPRPSSPSPPSPTRPPSTSGSPSRIPPPPRSAGTAQRVLDSMSEAQRVGQLLMVDCPSTGVASATTTAIRSYDVGSVILDGDSTLSVAQTRAITDRLQAEAPTGTKLFVSTDQEGGLVRRLRGPGFSDIPSAVAQGSLDPAALESDARTWGGQLHAAGVNVDLAPVLDTVPSDSAGNPPIGDLDREYGRTPAAVAGHGTAVARGLAAAGVDATVKHFPGLGRVSGNTDTSAGVTDSVTTRHDAYLAPFAAAIRAGVPFVMMSTAIYSRIDPGTPAAFSPAIVTGMLRHDLGFRGVVISDDLGAARQVGGYSVGDRAVAFVAAGGDLVLTVNATQAQEMTSALLARTRADPGFRRQVDAAALRVLQAKQARGLLG